MLAWRDPWQPSRGARTPRTDLDPGRGGEAGVSRLAGDGERLKVILTHDIDWPPQGPGPSHVLARRERFDPETVEKAVSQGFNPYNNIERLKEIEKGLGVRSTFFFRPMYDDGTPVSAYAGAMRALLAGGWEVGAHLNDAGSLRSVKSERESVASAAGRAPEGCRVHYLRLHERSHFHMREAGFSYDSSVMYSRNEVTPRNAGCITREGLVVFPITIMDAYLFTYVKVPEEKILSVFDQAVRACGSRRYMTVLWHDSSLLMKGGRMYSKVCEMLATRGDVEVVTAGDAFRSASAGATE
jgi:hypothetical protein